MKKLKAISIAVSIAMLLSVFSISCSEPNVADDPTKTENSSGSTDKKDDKKQDDDKKDNPGEGGGNQSDPDDEDQDDNDSPVLQSLLDTAQDGTSVTLDKKLKGSSIEIKKKLTVNGNGIPNLSVVVNPDVADNVKLKNFVNASITIKESDAGKKSRAARDIGKDPDPGKSDPTAPEVKPKEIGDSNPKLYIENCTFDKISAEEDISIYMEEDDLKSAIKEIELKEGIENFAVIADEEDELETDKKSSIDKITIEKGVEVVELLGGYYKDIELKGDFTDKDKFEFYYDEKGDQVNANFKAYLDSQAAKISARDICNVKNGEGIYKFTIPADEIDNLNNGKLAIILMTDAQKETFLATDPMKDTNWSWASITQPYFEISYTGNYLFDVADNDVHSICGVAKGNYFGSTNTTDYYEFYNNYSKDGICSQKTNDGLDIYLDLSKVVKSDLITCAFKDDGFTDEYYCQPNKLTEIDLKGYKPYMSVDMYEYDPMFEGKINTLKTKYTFENDDMLGFPASKSNGSQGAKYGYFTAIPSATAYPDVTNVKLNSWECADMIKFYEVFETGEPSLVRRMPYEEFYNGAVYENVFEEYDFYLDEECTQLFWQYSNEDPLDKIYVKPMETITCYRWQETDDYSRRLFWLMSWNGSSNIPKMGVFTKMDPTYEELQENPDLRITDINQLIPGEKYYFCEEPLEFPLPPPYTE